MGYKTRIRGNVFEVTGYPTLNSFEMYLSCSNFQVSCINPGLHFYVHTRETSTNNWELVWDDINSDPWSSGSLVSSGNIGIVLQEGYQVALSVGWENANLAYIYDAPSQTSYPTIGSLVSSILIDNPTDLENPTLSMSTYWNYYQKLSTTRLE